MQLYGSLTSPYARKVRIAAAELGVMDRIEYKVMDVSSMHSELLKLNPLHKVPVLVADDGTVLFDSPVIAEFLDATYGPKLVPASGKARWSVMTTLALGDGIIDVAAPARTERLKPEGQRSTATIEKNLGKVNRGLDTLESDETWRSRDIDMGQIAVICAIGYLEFRFADLAVLGTRPKLAAWWATMCKRASVADSVPQS